MEDYNIMKVTKSEYFKDQEEIEHLKLKLIFAKKRIKELEEKLPVIHSSLKLKEIYALTFEEFKNTICKKKWVNSVVYKVKDRYKWVTEKRLLEIYQEKYQL